MKRVLCLVLVVALLLAGCSGKKEDKGTGQVGQETTPSIQIDESIIKDTNIYSITALDLYTEVWLYLHYICLSAEDFGWEEDASAVSLKELFDAANPKDGVFTIPDTTGDYDVKIFSDSFVEEHLDDEYEGDIDWLLGSCNLLRDELGILGGLKKCTIPDDREYRYTALSGDKVYLYCVLYNWAGGDRGDFAFELIPNPEDPEYWMINDVEYVEGSSDDGLRYSRYENELYENIECGDNFKDGYFSDDDIEMINRFAAYDIEHAGEKGEMVVLQNSETGDYYYITIPLLSYYDLFGLETDVNEFFTHDCINTRVHFKYLQNGKVKELPLNPDVEKYFKDTLPDVKKGLVERAFGNGVSLDEALANYENYKVSDSWDKDVWESGEYWQLRLDFSQDIHVLSYDDSVVIHTHYGYISADDYDGDFRFDLYELYTFDKKGIPTLSDTYKIVYRMTDASPIAKETVYLNGDVITDEDEIEKLNESVFADAEPENFYSYVRATDVVQLEDGTFIVDRHKILNNMLNAFYQARDL